MRTNEDLAMLVKQGDPVAIAELWEQNKWLLHKLMSRFYPLCPKYGLTTEDLMQEAYFALDCAVNAYDPAKGLLFTSYLSYHIRNAAHNAFGHRGRKEPAPLVVSLDAPIKGLEDESLTLGDSIEDEAATQEMERIQDDWQREQLSACLDDCIHALMPEQAEIIRARYYKGKTVQATADAIGIDRERARSLEQKALRALRHPQHAGRLESFLFESAVCHGYGWISFKDRGYVSKVEVLAGTY